MASGKKKGVSHVPECAAHALWEPVVVFSRFGYAVYSITVALWVPVLEEL